MGADFHLHFSCETKTFDIHFQEQAVASSKTVLVNGRNYTLLGENHAWLREKIPELSSHSSISIENLSSRLTILGATDVSVMTVEQAYTQLAADLESYADERLGNGALLVKVIGVKGAEDPLTFGTVAVEESTAVDERTIGRTGSGAKLWAGLLTKILERKYGRYFSLSDQLVKFAPQETLRKFGRMTIDSGNVVDAELAKEISMKGIIGMTAGLEYEMKGPQAPSSETLDQLMRSEAIADGAIQMIYDPRDQIACYSNNICLIAFPVEKAYKKVLAEEHYKDLSITVGSTSKGEALSPEIQQLTLQDLLECEGAYLDGAYVYDLLDLFLSDLKPPLDNFTYAQIMRRELLMPMGMQQSGFYGTEGVEMAVTYRDSDSGKDVSQLPPHENVMLQGAGGGRTTLSDAAKLARGLVQPEGLIAADGETVLLDPSDLDDLFKSHSQYEGWGLGGSEISCGGKFVEKGGSFNQDEYTFWVDRESGVGLIAMSNCGRSPVHLLDAFQTLVKNIHHPDAQEIVQEKEETPIEMAPTEYLEHPLVNPKEYYEGTRGKVALLFDYETDSNGIMHWSGTPFQVQKQENGRFRITTPGRFENVEVWKVRGTHTGQDYLAIGDTSFIRASLDMIPRPDQVAFAKAQFPQLEGDYLNPLRPDWGVFRFKIIGEGENSLLSACWVADKSEEKAMVPLGIIKVEREKNQISFNGHDRQPPDKIFRFVRASESDPWHLQITDVSSPEMFIEERQQ